MLSMPKKKSITVTAEGKFCIYFLGAKVKFCVTQHIDILYDPKSLQFPDLLVLTCFISTPK